MWCSGKERVSGERASLERCRPGSGSTDLEDQQVQGGALAQGGVWGVLQRRFLHHPQHLQVSPVSGDFVTNIAVY